MIANRIADETNGPIPLDPEMAELSLLLPRAQALGVIEAATRQGLSVAQFLRRLVNRALTELTAPPTSFR